MRIQLLLLLGFTFLIKCTLAQLTDQFTDGEYNSNPIWNGSASDWIVNPSLQLQSNNATASNTFFITTANSLATQAQWDFYSQLTFNTSGANYVDVFLVSNAADLTSTSTSGYFVRIGNTDDEISLYRKDGATSVKIIDGTNGILNSSNNIMRIRITRNSSNEFSLLRDLGNTGSYFLEGTATDATYLTTSFFGLLVRQSTASFFQRHFFDDFEVKPFVPDVTPPVVQSVNLTGANTIDVLFNEPVELTSAETSANYFVDNGIGVPSSVVRDVSNPSLVHITFANSFPNRVLLTMTVNGVKDLAGNAVNNGTATFMYYVALPYEVVINEIMADPTPQVGLPASEWIELKNTSIYDVNLAGWRIGDASSQSGAMPAYILKPDSFVVITSSGGLAELSAIAPAISVTSFPSLDNGGDLIYLRSAEGAIIHSVNYSDSWYNNELKKAGGWTLEMKDTRNPCSGFTNWSASSNVSGGTPGAKNSIDANNPDVTAPKLLQAYSLNPITVVLVFDEPLDSSSSADASKYSISNGIGSPVSALPLSISFTSVRLQLAAPLASSTVYTVTVNGVRDCSQNVIGTNNTAQVGLSQFADSLDIVINEILFNPHSSGVDYVELYSRSNKIIDLSKIYLANRNSSGVIASITQLTTESRLLFPNQFVVLTTSKELVMQHYVANDPAAFLVMNAMPSFSDGEGTVIILNEQGEIIDEVKYDEDWHFSLISNKEGVSIERISYDGPSNDKINWHSASSSVGYGTPTYKNSQSAAGTTVEGTITVSPSTISPDNDGRDDYALISYQFPEPGYVSNITIFDAVGRPVRNLQRNALNGITGTYRWDGLSDKRERLPVGIYILYTEVFNLEGKSKKYKNVIVIAR